MSTSHSTQKKLIESIRKTKTAGKRSGTATQKTATTRKTTSKKTASKKTTAAETAHRQPATGSSRAQGRTRQTATAAPASGKGYQSGRRVWPD